MDPALLAGAPKVGAPRGPIGRADEARVAPAAARPPRHHHALGPRGEVAQPLARVAVGDDGAEGHAQEGVLTGGTVLGRALAVLAALRRVVALVVKIEQGGDGGGGFEEDAPPVAAVAAVAPPARHIRLAAERDAARPTVAALDEDIDLVDEHGRSRGARVRLGGLLGDADVLVVALALEADASVGGGERR